MARNKFDVDEELESPFDIRHFKRALKYVGKYKKQVIISMVLSVFAAVIGAVAGAIAMIFVGVISIPAAFSAAVMFIGGGILGLAVFAAVGVLAVIGLRKAVSAMVKDIRKRNERKGAERKCE